MEKEGTFIHFKGLLSNPQLELLHTYLAKAEFVDGRATATMAASDVKNNRQVGLHQAELLQHMQMILMDGLNNSPLFHAVTLPKQIYTPLFSEYSPGMYYGWHVDSPIMGFPHVRTDIAMTIFLNDPDEYEGGELEIQTQTGLIRYKFAKGDAVCYPCNFLHRVNEVQKGKRQVAVTWIQSLVKNQEQRQVLFELHQLHQHLYQNKHIDEANRLLQTRSNLLRMWSEV